MSEEVESDAFLNHNRFAKNLAFEREIIWDAYKHNEFEHFKKKLKELFRDPEPGVENSKKNKKMELFREHLYNQTIAQAKYTNKVLLTTFILITVGDCDSYEAFRSLTSFSMHLVIRTRKCIDADDSSQCCMIFIDELGNVYQNWAQFVKDNALPAGMALAPKNGIYSFNTNDELDLECWPTPASSVLSKLAGVADTATGCGCLAAAAVTVGAMATPVLAPAAAAFGAVSMVSGIYTSIRSGYGLKKRYELEQSISDKSALTSWLGVISGPLSLGTMASSRSLANAALAGRDISLVHEAVVNGLTITSMLVSGTGLSTGILDLLFKWKNDEEIGTMDLLQLAASLSIFTHSVYNFRLASTIKLDARNAGIRAYRDELSNRQRRMFDKMSKETVRIRGENRGKADLIRLINEVPDNQYLNDLYRVNRNLNQNNVRFAAGENGNVVLNEQLPVQPDVLRASVQHGSGGNILGGVSNPIPQTHQTVPNQNAVNVLTQFVSSTNSQEMLPNIIRLFSIADTSILSSENLQSCIGYILEDVGLRVTEFLIEKAREFIDNCGREIESAIKTKLHFEKVLWDLYTKFKDDIAHMDLENLARNTFKLFTGLTVDYMQTVSTVPTGQIKCDVCPGYYQICPI